MLLGVSEEESMDKEVYLRFMLNPEMCLEKVRAFPTLVQQRKIDSETISTLNTYLQKLGNM